MQLALNTVLFAVLAGGCVGSAQVAYEADVTTPNLVVISPGVQVIADADDPVFYSGGFYWRSDGGRWFRSRSHSRGWARYESPPVEIRRISKPSVYVRYQGTAHVAPAPRPAVRDHRAPAPAPRHDAKHDKKHDKNHDKKHD